MKIKKFKIKVNPPDNKPSGQTLKMFEEYFSNIFFNRVNPKDYKVTYNITYDKDGNIVSLIPFKNEKITRKLD